MNDDTAGTEVVRREDVEKAPQEAQDRSQLPSGMLEPVADPTEIVESRAKRSGMIADALIEGRDYGSVRGIPKPFLQKPGAERLTDAFGCYPRFRIIDQEVDHDRRVEWEKKRRDNDTGKLEVYDSGTSKGLYRYVVSCDLIHRASGIVVGNGLGACSTMESKYIDRPRDSENTALKMAKKRAHVDAALSTFGLSEMFTQDSDYVRENGGPDRSTSVLERHPPKGKHTDKTWAKVADRDPSYVKWAKGNTDWLTDDEVDELRSYVLEKQEGSGKGESTSSSSSPENENGDSGASEVPPTQERSKAPEPGEPLSDKQVVEKARRDWITYWESVHGEGTTGERMAWEAERLDPHLLKDEETPDHSRLDEEDYGMLVEKLADEESQTEMEVGA